MFLECDEQELKQKIYVPSTHSNFEDLITKESLQQALNAPYCWITLKDYLGKFVENPKLYIEEKMEEMKNEHGTQLIRIGEVCFYYKPETKTMFWSNHPIEE